MFMYDIKTHYGDMMFLGDQQYFEPAHGGWVFRNSQDGSELFVRELHVRSIMTLPVQCDDPDCLTDPPLCPCVISEPDPDAKSDNVGPAQSLQHEVPAV